MVVPAHALGIGSTASSGSIGITQADLDGYTMSPRAAINDLIARAAAMPSPLAITLDMMTVNPDCQAPTLLVTVPSSDWLPTLDQAAAAAGFSGSMGSYAFPSYATFCAEGEAAPGTKSPSPAPATSPDATQTPPAPPAPTKRYLTPRNVLIGVGVLALAGLGAAAFFLPMGSFPSDFRYRKGNPARRTACNPCDQGREVQRGLDDIMRRKAWWDGKDWRVTSWMRGGKRDRDRDAIAPWNDVMKRTYGSHQATMDAIWQHVEHTIAES